MSNKLKIGLVAALLVGLVTILISVGLYRRQARAKLPVTVVSFSAEKDAIPITSWRICGPFVTAPKDQHDSSSTNEEMLATDYLKSAGGQESPLLLPSAITNVPINFKRDYLRGNHAPPVPDVFLNQTVQFPNPNVNTVAVFWSAYRVFKVVYAAADVVSRTDQDVVLMTAADSPLKIWINDVPQIQTGVGKTKAEMSANRIHLQTGHNRLLLKVMCYPNLNNFAIWFTTPTKAQQYILEHNEMFKASTELIVQQDASLAISPIVANIFSGPSESDGRWEIRDIHGSMVRSGKVTAASSHGIRLSELSDGLYSLSLAKDALTMGNLIFVGDPNKRLAMYTSLCAAHHSITLPCEVLPLLTDAVHSDKAFHFEEQGTIIFLMSQLEWAIHNITPEQRFDDDVPRIRLVQFQSKATGSLQYYFLYMPRESLQDEPLPLVVTFVYQPETKTFYAPDKAFEFYTLFARKHHIGFITPIFGASDSFTDVKQNIILEALNDAKSRLKVDTNRIYLSGDCDAGRIALLMAEKYPNVFSAVSVFEPMIGEYSQLKRNKDEYFNVYLHQKNLSSMPVRLVQCATGNYHSPLPQDLSFAAEAKSLGFTPDLKILPCYDNGTGEMTYPQDTMFEFFTQINGRDSEKNR